jgi:hypothetical protein
MPLRTNIDKVPAVEMEYKLPSAGLPYLAEHPDFPASIKISPYSMRTEAHLVGNATMSDKMAFITSKVAALPKDFPMDSLLVADEFAILAIARALTYGEDYVFRTQCPNCDVIGTETIKVPDGLPVRVWDRTKPPSLSVKLPVCGDMVSLQMLTIGNDKATHNYARSMAAQSDAFDPVSIGWTRRMAYHIAAVNGGAPSDIAEAEQWMLKLKGADEVAFVESITEHQCGIKFDWWITCDRCQFTYERNIPIASDFFRRNRPRRSDTAPGTEGKTRDPSEDGVSAKRPK